MAATRGTETATVASTGPCTTTTTTITGPTGPTGPGTTSVASSAASSTAAATGRSTSPEWETSPRPPRPRAESISDSDQTDAVFCDPWLNCSSMHPDKVLVVRHLHTTLLTVMVGAL